MSAMHQETLWYVCEDTAQPTHTPGYCDTLLMNTILILYSKANTH